MGTTNLHALYENRLRDITEPSFDAIRRVASQLLSNRYSSAETDCFYDDLDRGKAILDREELLWQYLHSFGKKHQRHLGVVFNKLPRLKNIFAGGYSIVDWGCGQGLATVCLLDFLKAEGISTLPQQVVLVDPSAFALGNAWLHVGLYGVDEIRLVEKLLDDVNEEDVRTDSPVTIHLFANILDVEGFELKKLANLVAGTAQNDAYVVCVSPHYRADRRLFEFERQFVDVDVYAAESLVKPLEQICASYAVFKFTPGVSSVMQAEYYPPVQFHAAYQLDSVAAAPQARTAQDWALLSAFEIAAPFELGGHVYDDVPRVLAVLNNIVTRGLPTKCSPFIEEAFAPYGEVPLPDRLGTIAFGGQLSNDRAVRLLQEFSPIGVARVQKTILEALICRKLKLGVDKWSVLAKERDVPCVALAFEDLAKALYHLASMSQDFRDLVMPRVELTVVANEAWADSPLHLRAAVVTEASDELKSRLYDMVIDVAACSPIDPVSLGFREFRASNDCYFAIGSSEKLRSTRQIYTSDNITYFPLGSNDQHGGFVEDPRMVGHLTYFLELLFRKREFRPGQVPILNRALQGKNVIGLLPTGGGKSLTYQLAAMMQPGVTIVVDPLRSLMQDQYEGLLASGIDSCAYINSTISDAQKRAAEHRMESSELQFVFLSPERLCIYEFRERLRTMHEMNVYFAYGVIDEVHCVSEWGHDFRFSYLHLGRNLYRYVHAKDLKKRLTLFGLTATASFDVLADVERELSGDGAFQLDANTIVRYENTDRLELQYKVERVPIRYSDERYPDLGKGLPKPKYISGFQANTCKSEYLAAHIFDIPAEIGELQTSESISRIRTRFAERQNDSKAATGELLGSGDLRGMLQKRARYDQGAIVFCPHRTSTGVSVDVNREALSGLVPDVGTFVGSSEDDKQRDEESFRNLSRFKHDEQPLMIATKAFGMGIDKPNVRFTVNMNYPSSLESFVQEAGRAGRDQRISLATILVGDYRLARVSPECQIGAWPIPKIKGHWYNEADLYEVLAHFGASVPTQFIDVATPENDWVMAQCAETGGHGGRVERKRRREMFARHGCDSSCESFWECKLRLLPDASRGWRRYAEVEGEFDRLRIPKTNLVYLNTDYGNNMFFYNNNFLGERAEKKALYDLFCQTPSEVLVGDADRSRSYVVPDVMDAVLSLPEGERLVAFINYTERRSDGGKSYSGAQKAIYRMCCIGFIDDFTQDYANRQFRLVMVRKPDGGYYEGLWKFLTRYYADDRARELVAQVPERHGNNEVQKCLGFLTEFIYSKIAVKRKRALDDVRTFCAMGVKAGTDWKVTNEELKDYIYYYFNSKYAQEGYVADNGDPFSLTEDTDRGRLSLGSVVLKYLRVVDDDLVGAGGTPIDNVKHLQGAVRLIRRSVTEDNHCLELLNYFCLTQLGTNESVALEEELRSSYRAGMVGFAESFDKKRQFWRFKHEFDEKVNAVPYRYDTAKVKELQDEVTAEMHLRFLQEIRHTYAG